VRFHLCRGVLASVAIGLLPLAAPVAASTFDSPVDGEQFGPLSQAASASQRVQTPFPPAPPARRLDSDTGALRTAWTTSAVRFELEFQGMLTLSDDDRDVVEISPGGSLQLAVDGPADLRRVQLSALPDGSIDRRYWLSGTEQPWEPEGRAWWSEVLPTIVRRSGFAAEQRVARILKSEGPSGVLAAIEGLDTDAVRARYFRHLFTQAQLDDVTRATFFDKLGSIDSSRELRTVLEAIAESAPDDAALAAAIGATRHMESSVEIAGFLTSVASRRALQGALRDAYVEAAGRISRAQRGDVLLALGAAGNAR
jgi:hypothetical protein